MYTPRHIYTLLRVLAAYPALVCHKLGLHIKNYLNLLRAYFLDRSFNSLFEVVMLVFIFPFFIKETVSLVRENAANEK